MKKLLCVLLVIGMLFALAACGKKEEAKPAETAKPESGTAVTTPAPAPEPEPEPEPATGEEENAGPSETKTWGDWSVSVPGGFELKGGDSFDENDTRYFSVKKSDFVFFDFKADGEQNIMNHYNYNKQTYTNEQVDVEARLGDADWVGFQYSDGWGGYGFEAYATVNGQLIRVSCCGFRFDSDTAKEILGSLVYSGT